ncbi:MAG: hypothetical protein US42_C0014G0027 [Candidatus Magasanikbacteria bacterium GW2011_GWC2_37_14]|uniref:Uncharacterized protein n=1 Tax=Candidatus Magasanikbacteria bacterium GW2011_GWC2_37_14 TaxID=1619046 RepID=A0A0G0GLW3_9BACT|nr:MAG: hypothetical protein US42_C0014G0027 [Candidatus Magasanikbacteria bacterium GW2011_GWC2_37_14]
MSFFGSTEYSTNSHHLHEPDIRHLASHHKVASLEDRQEKIVAEAIMAARDGEHRISMQKIHDVLYHLREQSLISEHDRSGLMVEFKDFFNRL